jgi:hypothetical protein
MAPTSASGRELQRIRHLQCGREVEAGTAREYEKPGISALPLMFVESV